MIDHSRQHQPFHGDPSVERVITLGRHPGASPESESPTIRERTARPAADFLTRPKFRRLQMSTNRLTESSLSVLAPGSRTLSPVIRAVPLSHFPTVAVSRFSKFTGPQTPMLARVFAASDVHDHARAGIECMETHGQILLSSTP